MRILHITPRYLPAFGGAEIHLHEISARLVTAGHQVQVLTSDAAAIDRFWDSKAARVPAATDVIDGVRVRRFPLHYLLPHPAASRLAYRALRRLLWWGARLRLPAGIAARVARLTPRLPDLHRWLAQTTTSFDLVAGLNITYESVLQAGLTFARRRDLPHVVYPLTHLGAGAAPGQDNASRWYTMPQQRQVVAGSSALVAQTRDEADYYSAQNAAPPLVRIVGPGVTPAAILGGDATAARTRWQLQHPVILYLGTMSFDKGAVHLVQAAQHLWATGRQLDVVLAGAILPAFAAFLQRIPPADRVRLHILGVVSEQEKRDLYAAAAVFALPSRVDSFGLGYLEAWLYGTPVIAARTWGVKNLIADGEDGRLIPFGDVGALSHAIAHLLDEPETARAWGERGRAKVHAEHTWDKKFPRILALYQQLLDGGPA